jgi:putative molybdenum carrier protein
VSHNLVILGKIISGGQTGANRAALDFAIEHDIPHGGWCPKGRKSEDGPLEPKYRLTETPSASYPQRTEWNVRDSDGIVIFSLASALTGGSKKTAAFAIKHKKPWLHICRDGQYGAAESLRRFLSDHMIETLNVAGARASREPQISDFVKKVLEEAFFPRRHS